MVLHLPRRSARLAFALACLASALDAQVTQARGRIVPELERLADHSSFSGRETLIDFEGVLPGTPIGNQFISAGASFRLSGGQFPAIWRDPNTRVLREVGPRHLVQIGNDQALNNFLAYALGDENPTQAPDCSLEVRFGRQVSRIGFEIRAGHDEILNAEVRCLRNGTLVGRGHFEADEGFRFVGFRSRIAFDEIRLVSVNPARNTFSLDDLVFELDLTDRDRDGILDFADLCPSIPGVPQTDTDRDGIGDGCDPFPFDPLNDVDGDGIGGDADNSPFLMNPDQEDVDLDGIGDVGEQETLGNDLDGDGIPDAADNCPGAFNPEQADCDGDLVGDVCDHTLVFPASLSLTMARGESLTLTKRICLPPVPRKVDVVIAFDLTGSMSAELAGLKANIARFMTDLRAGTSSDIRFGLVSLRDYPSAYSSCNYSRVYGGPADHPFRVDAPIGSSDAAVVIALNALATGGGGDGPEAYTRALWEVAQPDSGIGWRRGAGRFVILVCDDVPHDCVIHLGLSSMCTPPRSTGQDPGRDGVLFTADDLYFIGDAIEDLVDEQITLFTIFSSPLGFCAWNRWSRLTGGRAVQINSDASLPPGVDLDSLVLDVLTDPIVHRVELVPLQDCGLEFSFDPPFLEGPFDVSMGATLFIEETVTVPLDFPEGNAFCGVVVLADGAVVGTQKFRVALPCETVTFEGFVNGEAIQPGDFLSQGFTLTTIGPNRGAAVFDSSPGGPNAGSSDPDLLVNLGKLLILQENPGQSVPGIFDLPDDARFGGTFTFDFTGPVQLESIVLVDIDSGQPATVTLTDGAGATRRYSVPAHWTTDIASDGPPGFGTLDLMTLAPQPGFVGNATATETAGFDQTHVLRMTVQLTGSGAIDDPKFCPTR